MKGLTRLTASIGLLMWPCHILAQSHEPANIEGRQVYEASYFEQFAPANALQLVQQVPGFTLESGDTGVRGFTQAAGNVVINGARPTNKSDDLETVLARIPASRVLRVEVASGNVFGADYSGKPQVVNLVLREDAGLSGTVELRATRYFAGSILPKASAALVYQKGASSFSASLTHEASSILGADGFDRVVALPSRTELELRDKYIRHRRPYTLAAVGWALEEAEDRSAHLSAKASFDKWVVDETSDIFRGGSLVEDSLYLEDHLWRTYEVSGDIRRPLGGGAITLNALATHRHRRNDDIFERNAGVMAVGGFVQDFDDYSNERVARIAWKRDGLAGWTIEIGTEGAYNHLKSDLSVFDVDAQGNVTQVDLPIDEAIVSEYRNESFANAERALSSNLRLSLGLNYETSRLKVTGDAEARRNLDFFKPRASLEWSPGDWQFQLSALRSVAQLQFADFVSGTKFNTGQVDGGNAELQPQRKWEFLLSTSRPFFGDGRVKLDLGYNAVSMVQDRIPLKEVDPGSGELVNTGLDAPGNLGGGREWIAEANIDLPLGKLGVDGGRLTLTGAYLDSSVTDPYTFADRHFSGAELFAYSAELRQDFASFAWGIELSGDTGSTGYRLAEIDESQDVSPSVDAFVEFRPRAALTVTLGGTNLTNAASKRWRTFYSPDRTASAPFSQEYRERNSHRKLYVSATYSFG